MNYSIIIPARYESTRLPGKPLIDLDGIPMVVRTYRQCAKACPAEKIYVATDDPRVEAVCGAYGIQSLKTSSDCLTGTDRVAECAEKLEDDIFINVQGDEPVFNPDDILRLIEAIHQYPGEVLNGICEIHEESEFRSTSTPKAVVRNDGRLLYMSRAAIPTSKKNEFTKAWRQVCAYAFPRTALKAFKAQPVKTPLELIEDIEILRFLELGFEVRMIKLSDDSIAVDLPEDVPKVIAAIKHRGL
jgi:3-deoxy-manno-octulosonate cytidylyltransferase (CMP-KDO synthetase)